MTLRTDWVEVHFEACRLAVDVFTTMRARGFLGSVARCGDRCLVPRAAAA